MARAITITAWTTPRSKKTDALPTAGKAQALIVDHIVEVLDYTNPNKAAIKSKIIVKYPSSRGLTDSEYQVTETRSALVTAINA